MKAKKNINNNITICTDNKGRELIAFGKGIGFIKPPFEVPLEKIDRTFYNVKDLDYDILNDLPENVILVSMQILDMVSDKLKIEYPSKTVFILADHINFAIKRNQEHIALEIPLIEDLKQLHSAEFELANVALKQINDKLNCNLPDSEVITLALHFINDKFDKGCVYGNSNGQNLIEEITSIVEKEFNININRKSFNYSRFVTHLDYLFRRMIDLKQIDSTNKSLYEKVKDEYKSTYNCAVKISKLIYDRINLELYDEELLYLMLHINRLCSRD